MELMVEENSEKMLHQLRSRLATQKQQLIHTINESLSSKLDIAEYQRDQQNKASCQSVSEVLRYQ